MFTPVKPPFLDYDGPVAFAHRGGMDGPHPENTMAAFQAAYDMGYRYFETDTQATHDGVLLAYHDDRLERLTDKEGRIGDLMWKDIRHIRIRDAYTIPRLEEVLTTWPDVFVNIEPKTDRAASLLPTLLRDPALLRRVCVGSFAGKRLDELRRIFGPRLCTSMGPSEVFRLKLKSLGFPVAGFVANCAQVPLYWRGIRLVTPAFVEAAHEAELKVHVWTVNDAATMAELLDMGVDGIMTDKLSVLKDLMQERGLWRGPAHAEARSRNDGAASATPTPENHPRAPETRSAS